MDKRKLIEIIVKDLEELKILTEEIAESEISTSLIYDLAINRARLLSQEFELMKETTVFPKVFQSEMKTDEEDEAEYSLTNIPEPELEILNFESSEFNEEFEPTEEPEVEEEFDDKEEEEIEESEEEIQEEEDEIEIPEIIEPEVEEEIQEEQVDLPEDEDEEEEIESEEEIQEDELTVPEAEEEDEDIDEAEEEDEELEDDFEEESVVKPQIEVTELNTDLQPGFREIHIDDLDDEDDLEPIQFAPVNKAPERPVMREIPKPEEPEMVQGKKVFGESFQKERSLNDSIGQNKVTESKLTNGSISSLRAAIGLNDRFLFIREIFENNTDKYNKVIDHLDKLEEITEAVDFLKANLTLQKNETSLKFVDLLKRRFSK